MTTQEIQLKIDALNTVMMQNLGNIQVTSYIVLQIAELKKTTKNINQ